MSEESRQEKFEKATKDFHPHCIRCGYPLLHEETTCPQCGIQIQISPEELQKQKMEYIYNNSKWTKVGNAALKVSKGAGKVGDSLNSFGNTMIGCVTIPVIILIILFLLGIL